MTRTVVATPCYGGQMTVGFFRTCMGISQDPRGTNVDFLVTEGESHITRARNNLCATFENETDADTIAFIDADIEIQPADFFKLAEMDGVRGAAVAMKHGNGESLSAFRDGKQIKRSEAAREPFHVDFLGSAVLFIPRSALNVLKPLSASYDDPIVGPGWAYFWDGVQDGNWLSEDYGFCQSCKKAGIPITVAPDVIVRHYGTGVWEY